MVAWTDHGGTDVETSELTAGDEVVLFLERLPSADAPGIDTETDFYVPLGGDNAVFDVGDSNVTARSAYVIAFEDATPAGNDSKGSRRLTTTLEAFGAVVEEYAAS